MMRREAPDVRPQPTNMYVGVSNLGRRPSRACYTDRSRERPLTAMLLSLALMPEAIQSSCPRIDPRRNSGVGNKQQLIILRTLIPERQSCSVGIAILGKVRPVSP